MKKKEVSTRQRFLMICEKLQKYHQSQNDIVNLFSHTYKGFSKGSVNTIAGIIRDQGFTLESLQEIDEKRLEDLLKPNLNKQRNMKPLPDFEKIHSDLSSDRRMTLFFLWRRYRKGSDDTYSYQRFCQLYGRWVNENCKAPVMAFYNEPPGQNWYIDWMGDVLSFRFEDREEKVYFFCTSLGISGFPYMEGFLDTKLSSFIRGHIHALKYYGGVPMYAVPDNTKCAVIRNYEKEVSLNRVYEDMEEHYGYIVMAARVLEPTDKHEVENVCGWFERQVLMEIKDKQYRSLEALNADVLRIIGELSDMKFQKKNGTRRQWFNEYDRPLLRPLPGKEFEVFDYDCAKVPDNYHICLKEDRDHYYSVPYTLLGQTVIIKYSFTTILILDTLGSLVARHTREYSFTKRYTTTEEHMPIHHQIGYNAKTRDAAWYLEQASFIGDSTRELIENILQAQKYPEQGYRACMGIIAWHISHKYTDVQIDMVCKEALDLKQHTYSFVKRRLSELKNGNKVHKNIRGPEQFK